MRAHSNSYTTFLAHIVLAHTILTCSLTHSQGLDLEGAQQFWESHFTKIMNRDAFVKSYAYSFRHMYGKEGARKNYTPYSCMKIIMGTPPETGAYHGCPYKLVRVFERDSV